MTLHLVSTKLSSFYCIMAQTFQRINKTRKENDGRDRRKEIKDWQDRNLDKHKNRVYSLATNEEDDDTTDEDDLQYQ